jgi:hypothetical protein
VRARPSYPRECVPIASTSEADGASEVTGKEDGGKPTSVVVVLCSSIEMLPGAYKTKANLFLLTLGAFDLS